MSRVDVRRIVYAVVAGVLWGVPTEVVYLLNGSEALAYLSWIPADAFIWPAVPAILGLVVAIVVYAILGWRPGTESASNTESKKSRRFPWLNFTFDMKHVLVLAGVIFVCWLSVLVLMYPCSMNPDTTEQIFEFQTSAPTYYPWLGEYVDAEFVDHHPVFDTLLYGGITLLGDAIGSYNHAFFLFILLQSALGALGLAASCCYASRLGAPRVAVCVMAFLCAFLPVFPHFMGVVLKDSTFAVCWVPFLLCYLECFRTRGEALRSARFIVAFVLFAGLCLLTKKLGAYIVLPSLVMLVVACVFFARGAGACRSARRKAAHAKAATAVLSGAADDAAPSDAAQVIFAQADSTQTGHSQATSSQAANMAAEQSKVPLRDRLWVRAATTFAAVVLVFCVAFPAIVYPLVGGVAPGGKQEALGFAFQQVIAVIRDNPDSVTDDEYAAVDKVLDIPAASEAFKPFLTDGVKEHYRVDATTQDIVAFVGAWASIGVKNPVIYGKTMVNCAYRMLVPSSLGGSSNYRIPGKQFDKYYHRANDTQEYIESNGEYHLSIKRPEKLIEADAELRQIQGTVTGLPVISLISTLGFYGGMLPLTCLLLVLYHRRRLVWAYAPVLLSVFFLLLSPTAATRYILPLAFSAPLIVGWAYHAVMQAPLCRVVAEPVEQA